MNKRFLKACAVGLMTVPMFFMASCGENNAPKEPISVNYYDGETVLKTLDLVQGDKAEEWTPQIDGKSFLGWYGTPTFTHEFDFTKALDEDTSIFGAFVRYQKDERHWAIAGSGKSSLLASSNWGKVYKNEHYLKNESTDSENIFTITVNLLKNDEFQFTDPVINGSNVSWGHQRGSGYLVTEEKDGVQYFTALTGFTGSAYTSNIQCNKDGKYKLTLRTYPAEDTAMNAEPQNNRNYFDTIDFEYLGEYSEEVAEYESIFYMKGEKITGWGDYLTDYTTLTTTDGVAKLENVYLKADDQFMFASYEKNTSTNEMSAGNTYIKAENLSDASKALVDGIESSGNLKVKEDGYYSFAYNLETKKLEVTKVTYTPKAGAYYIDGSFISWGGVKDDQYLLVQDTTDTNLWKYTVTLAVGDELGIQYYDKSVENGYNGFFASKYLIANDAFDTTATNIKCKTAGTYVVTFNSYSHLITIAKQA